MANQNSLFNTNPNPNPIGGTAQPDTSGFTDSQMMSWINSFAKANPNSQVARYLNANQPNQQTTWQDRWFGDPTHQGYMNVGTDVLRTGLGAWLGWRNAKLAQDQFNFAKQSYFTNLRNQTSLTNQQLWQQQHDRWLANPNSYANPNDPNWQNQHYIK